MPPSADPPSSPRHPSVTSGGNDYRRLFDLSLDLLCVAGLDGFFKKVNPAWTHTLGWSEAELLARPVEDFMHPDDRERTLAARADLAKGIVLRGLENRYLCRDGSYRWLAWQSSVELADGKVFAVARDITDRLEMERERLIISKLESIGILAGGIAHDFNNLLGAMMLNLDMIALSGPISGRQDDNLRQARESVYAAEALTKQLISMAQGGASVRGVVELRLVLQQGLAAALNGASVAVEERFDPELWAVEGDEAQLAQLVRNLVLNARDAMPSGGTVRVAAHNTAIETGDRRSNYVRITVSDTGAGIAPEIMANIFDPYFSTKPRGVRKGMGLGLTISRAIVQKHGGTIGIESNPGEGTTVTVQLPAAHRATAMRPDFPGAPASDRVGTKVLVMDDEPLFREVVAQALRRFGYEVEVAKDGDEALGLYDRAEKAGVGFSAVLLDLTVRDGKGGAETLELLRARDPAVRGLVMTGYTGDEILRDYSKHGFRGALTKPFTAEAAHAELQRVLHSAV